MERKIKFWCAVDPVVQLYVKLNCAIFLSFSEHSICPKMGTKFEVLVAVKIKIVVFWDVMPWILCLPSRWRQHVPVKC